ncbi:MAG: thioredoxin family protein [Deltaproteobacteria bacterium]|nr:thioredoxin family protein [Deltaproteobacteria bacterium]
MMDWLQQIVVWGAGALVALMVVTQVMVRRRAAALRGQPAPALPGPLGTQVSRARQSLLYFFSPSCSACRVTTPCMRALREQNADVHLVDVSQDLAVASALGVMATPSTVEIVEGKVAAYHVGPPPQDVFDRYARAA